VTSISPYSFDSTNSIPAIAREAGVPIFSLGSYRVCWGFRFCSPKGFLGKSALISGTESSLTVWMLREYFSS